MSCTKGAVALCAHMLAAGGELDFDSPVSRYWPEFAANGKEGVLVRHVLSHQAGLPAIRTPLKPGAFYDWDYMVAGARCRGAVLASRARSTAITA